jgi:hypothetical protein
MPETITNASAQSGIIEALKKKGQIRVPDYSPNEIQYLGGLQRELEKSRNQRDTNHDEYDGMTYIESWQAEEKAANTFIAPKINADDTNFQSGIQRDSLISIVSQAINMDMGPSVRAFDETDLEISALGLSIEAIMDKVAYLEIDDEKRVQRAMELLKHGYYFVEEFWEERWHWAKTWISKFDGHIKSAKWKRRLKLMYARPTRQLLSGLNVYLGDITQYDYRYQPYIITVKYRSYGDAEAEYGRKDDDGKDVWDRWKYVTKVRQDYATSLGSQMIYNTWRLTDVVNEQVEEIHYQNKYNNEFAIILNGVLMTPIGMPLPWGYEDYNIVQQNLEPIHPYFAYGGSLIKRMKANSAIYDELLKMGVLKTQKSFAPPYINISGRAISKRVFMPGKISMGIKPGDLQPVHEKEIEGVTGSELEMIEKIESNISGKVQPPIAAGKSGGGKQTNAIIMAQQQSAKMAIGWFLFFITLGEQKLAWTRLFNILANWFDPIDKKIDEARKELVNQYRSVSQQTNIDGKGKGTRLVLATDKDVKPQDVKDTQDALEKKYGQPFQVIAIKPDELKRSQLTWMITVDQKEKKTSDSQKVLIRGMIADLQSPILAQGLDPSFVQEEYALAWGKDPAKMYPKSQQPGVAGNVKPPQAGQPGGGGTNGPAPKQVAGMPQPGKGLTQAISNNIS